jgi:hypothetical protein
MHRPNRGTLYSPQYGVIYTLEMELHNIHLSCHTTHVNGLEELRPKLCVSWHGIWPNTLWLYSTFLNLKINTKELAKNLHCECALDIPCLAVQHKAILNWSLLPNMTDCCIEIWSKPAEGTKGCPIISPKQHGRSITNHHCHADGGHSGDRLILTTRAVSPASPRINSSQPLLTQT